MGNSLALDAAAAARASARTRVSIRSSWPGIDAYPLEFTGSGAEYFRVWIVNVLLSVVTLGFYTPFARRRTAQYFYGHTLVADSPLEFVAQQRKMVFGFVILVGLYLAFKIAAETGQETTSSLLMLGAAVLAPYFWGSAMRFRLNATRWRGVRLQFMAGWGEIYRASWPVFAAALAWVVLGLAVAALPDGGEAQGPWGRPWAAVLAAAAAGVVVTILCAIRLEFNYKSLLVGRARIGGQAGLWKPEYRDFVRIWAATLGVLLASVLLVAAVVALMVGANVAMLRKPERMGLAMIVMIVAFVFLLMFVLFLASAPARAYREARVFQLVWNSVGVSRIARFRCELRPWRFVRLRVLNLLLTLLTLGFYRPFARVAEYRMKVESVTLHVKGGLDQLAGQLAREEQGLGDAIADAAGLDLVG
jgi:uncharacterized membrane protein YjgN (DUF898 family)